MPTPRPPRRDAVDNRSALLAAARVELNLDPEASLETIAASAGLSRRAVYGHFANRDELLGELVTLGAERVSAALQPLDHPDPLVRLALIAAGIWREVASIRVMAVFTVRGPLKPRTDAALEPLRARTREAIAEAVAAGSVRSDIPVPRLARLFEDAALAVLEESNRDPLAPADGHRLIIGNTLAVLGLGWREATALLDSTPELAWKDAA